MSLGVRSPDAINYLATPQWKGTKQRLYGYYTFTKSVSHKPKPFDLMKWRLTKYYKALPHETRLNFEIFVTASVQRKFNGNGQCAPDCKHWHHKVNKEAMYVEQEKELRDAGYSGLDILTGSLAVSELLFNGCLPFMIQREQGLATVCQVIEDKDAEGYYYSAFTDDREERLVWTCHKCGRTSMLSHEGHRFWKQREEEGGVQYRCGKDRWLNDARARLMDRQPKREGGGCTGTVYDLVEPAQVKLTWHRFCKYLNDDLKVVEVLLVGAAARTIQRNIRLYLRRVFNPVALLMGTPKFNSELCSTVRSRFYAKHS